MRYVTILGKRWRLSFVPRLRVGRESPDGACDSPKKTGKEIRIRRALLRYPRALMETLIHELLHAADWTKDETWIDETAADLARILWGVGFRMDADEEKTDGR